MSQLAMLKCKKCQAEMHRLEIFPGDICVNCHEAKMNKIPLNQLPIPDFTTTIRR